MHTWFQSDYLDSKQFPQESSLEGPLAGCSFQKVCGRGAGRCKCLGEVLRLAQLVAVSASVRRSREGSLPGAAPTDAVGEERSAETTEHESSEAASVAVAVAAAAEWLPPRGCKEGEGGSWQRGGAGPRAHGRLLGSLPQPRTARVQPAALAARAGGQACSELALRRRSPDGARPWCAYRGEPERFAAYAARRSHFWEQVLGGLPKKRRPRHDPAPLHARLCAGKKGHGAGLRLEPRASLPARPTAAGFAGKPKPGAGSRGRPRERAPGPTAGTPPPQSAPPKEKPSERKTKEGKRKAASVPKEERPLGTGPDPDGLDGNAELTETYCAEKWHFLCNFFVNFWNG
ncbi:Fibroblast growth factor-binding protein 3 [Plecturocebus cupreus]